MIATMPMYEYRCRACGDTFDRLRQLADADAPADCGCGSTDTARIPSVIARPSGGATLPMASAPPAGASPGGGCCGGGCCG